MNTSIRTTLLLLVALAALPSWCRGQAPIEVEPTELARRKDLIGREIIIDDRVQAFWPVPGHGYPKIYFKRYRVAALLPQSMAYESAPNKYSIRVQGILKTEGNDLVLHVTKPPELFKSDVVRLKNVISTLVPDDAKARSEWGDWASNRADAFADRELREMAQKLQAESIAIELRNLASQNPEALLALAMKAKKKGLEEPEPSALTHLALRMKLTLAKTKAEFQDVAQSTLKLLPNSKSAANASSRFSAEDYAKAPGDYYRRMSSDVQATLDRRLYADAAVEELQLRAKEDAKALLDLADEARDKLPDRPEVASEFVARYYETAEKNVTQLREDEMLTLAARLKSDPQKADNLIRTWLDNKRKHSLGANSADQRSALARKYFELLKDKAIAADLAREALKIDPTDREAADLFQRMGFVRSGDDWRDPRDPNTGNAGNAGALDTTPMGKDDPFIGLSPGEIKGRLGAPTWTSRVASQGRVSIQWIYEGPKGSQYLNFVQKAGEARPTLVGRFLLR